MKTQLVISELLKMTSFKVTLFVHERNDCILKTAQMFGHAVGVKHNFNCFVVSVCFYMKQIDVWFVFLFAWLFHFLINSSPHKLAGLKWATHSSKVL